MTVVRFEPPLGALIEAGERFASGLLHLEPLWDRFDPLMTALTVERWASEGFGEWPPLAESTIKEKARRGWPAEMMVRTHDLEESLMDPGRAANHGPLEMTWSTNVAYAHWHQDGGYVPGQPPQRVVLEVRGEDMAPFAAEHLDFTEELARRTWGAV